MEVNELSKKKHHDEDDEEEEDLEEEEDEEKKDEEEEEEAPAKAKTITPRSSKTDVDDFKKHAKKEVMSGGGNLLIMQIETGEVYRGVMTKITETEYKKSGKYHNAGDPLIRVEFNSVAVGLEDKYPPGCLLLGGATERRGEIKLSPKQNTTMTWFKEHKEELPVLVDFGELWMKPQREGGRKYKVMHFEIVKHLKLKSQKESSDEEEEEE